MVFITTRHALNTADRTGGGIFALRRPRPYSRHLRGWRCDPNAGHCRLYAHFLRPTYPHEPVVLKRRGTPHRYKTYACRTFQSRAYSSSAGAFFVRWPTRRFFAPGGRMRAAGLLRVGLCARLSQRRGRVGARGGRSASRAKAPGTSPGASFLSPLSLAIQRKGA